MDDQTYREYVEKIVDEINGRGMVACFRETEFEGQNVYGVRIVEDPNFQTELLLWYNTSLYTNDPHGVEKYVDWALNKLKKDSSPLKDAIRVLSKRGYDKIKDKLVPMFVSKEKYGYFLETVPHRDFLDFAVTYCYHEGPQTVTINNALAEQFGLTEEMLYEEALKNLKAQDPVPLSKLVPEVDKTMFVLSDSEFVAGAATMLLPDCLAAVSKKLGGDFYLFMCMNMFLIAAPSEGNDPDSLKGTAEMVYKRFVKPELVFSDKCYKYGAADGKIV